MHVVAVAVRETDRSAGRQPMGAGIDVDVLGHRGRRRRHRHDNRAVDRDVETGRRRNAVGVAHRVGKDVMQMAAGCACIDRRCDIGAVTVAAVGIQPEVAVGARKRLADGAGTARDVAHARDGEILRRNIVLQNARRGDELVRALDHTGSIRIGGRLDDDLKAHRGGTRLGGVALRRDQRVDSVSEGRGGDDVERAVIVQEPLSRPACCPRRSAQCHRRSRCP